MNYGVVFRVLGFLLIIEAVALLLPLAVAWSVGGPDSTAFLLTAVLTGAAGLGGMGFRSDGPVRFREAFLIVAAGWLLASCFGSLPFMLAGSLPSFVDAFFETVSGFTTTGATVITAVEAQPLGILFWRSLTHWLGGMGIIVFTLALLPALGIGSMRIFQAESPGPAPGKLVSRVDQTAQRLYSIYIGLTGIMMVALRLSGLSWFDAATHTFATVGTGGFSTKNASVASLANPWAEWIIAVFMLASGVNFSLYYAALRRQTKLVWRDGELRFYLGLVGAATALIVLQTAGPGPGGWIAAVRQSFFQVVSMVTTTGFTTVNYERWPQLCQMILLLLMFMGGCAGSTGGAIKQVRIVIVLKALRRRLTRLLHPRAVIPVSLGGTILADETVDEVLLFVLFYLFIFVAATLLLLTQGLDMVSSSSAVAATLGNVGPGFGAVGPMTTFADLTASAKLLLSACMLLGRLEIYPLLALALPSFWQQI